MNKYSLVSDYIQKTANYQKFTNDVSNFLFIKQIDSEVLLPSYTEVMMRSSEHGINMEDLDVLQKDLETLLSLCAVRKRLLLLEIEPAVVTNEIRRNQGNKYQTKQLHLNQLIHGKTVSKIRKRVFEHQETENSNVVLFRNPVVERFWSFIEPYFSNVAKTDLEYIDSLIKESMQNIQTKSTDDYRNFFTYCPYNYHPVNQIPEEKNINLEYKKIKLNSRKFKLCNFLLESNEKRNEILEIEQCLKELKETRKNNLVILHKLRETARKRFFSQQTSKKVIV